MKFKAKAQTEIKDKETSHHKTRLNPYICIWVFLFFLSSYPNIHMHKNWEKQPFSGENVHRSGKERF